MARPSLPASVSARRLLVALAVPTAFLLGGCGAAGAPAVVGPTVVVPATGSVAGVSTSVATTVAPVPVTTTPVVVPTPAPAPVQAEPGDCSGDYYVNSDGNCVHRPEQAPSAPAGATAKCVDGSYSFSQHHSGTCSHHGGVAEWLA